MVLAQPIVATELVNLKQMAHEEKLKVGFHEEKLKVSYP